MIERGHWVAGSVPHPSIRAGRVYPPPLEVLLLFFRIPAYGIDGTGYDRK